MRKYVQVIFGDDVITLSAWDGKPVAKWIYDDTSSNAEPYVYWGQALEVGESTSNVMEAVRLAKQPEGDFYYSIRVDMEAVIKDQIDEWGVFPDEIYQAYFNCPESIEWAINASEQNKPNGSLMFGDASGSYDWTVADNDIGVLLNGTETTVTTGTGDVPLYEGPFISLTSSNVTPHLNSDGFTATLRLYLDPEDWDEEDGFCLSVALNDASDDYLCERMLHFVKSDGNILVNASSNIDAHESVVHYAKQPGFGIVSAAGWYWVGIQYRDNDGDIQAQAIVINESDVTVWSSGWLTIAGCDVSDFKSVRYFWFADLLVSGGLPLDEVQVECLH